MHIKNGGERGRTPDLGCDDEQGGLCVELGQGLGDVGSVDVGHEPDTGPAFGVRLQGLCHHQGPLGVKVMVEI